MPFETYPVEPIPSYIYVFDEAFKTIISEYEADNEQRRNLSRFSKRNFYVIYNNKDVETEWYLIHDFYRKRRGAYEPFWFFDILTRKWIDEYVGRGDGTTAIFDLHSKNTDSLTLKIYVNDILKISGTHYNFISGGGEGEADRIQFTAGNIPGAGLLISSELKGNLRIKATFPDEFGDENVEVNWMNIKAIKLREVH